MELASERLEKMEQQYVWNIAEVVKSNPLPDNRKLTRTFLVDSKYCTALVVQAQPQEEPFIHIHKEHDELVKMREAGLSYAEIGRRLGITRERVRQIFKGNPRPQKPDLQSKVMLTTSEAAHLVGVRPNTVRRWSNKGILKAYRIGFRRDRRFRRQDLDSFLKKAEIE